MTHGRMLGNGLKAYFEKRHIYLLIIFYIGVAVAGASTPSQSPQYHCNSLPYLPGHQSFSCVATETLSPKFSIDFTGFRVVGDNKFDISCDSVLPEDAPESLTVDQIGLEQNSVVFSIGSNSCRLTPTNFSKSKVMRTEEPQFAGSLYLQSSEKIRPDDVFFRYFNCTVHSVYPKQIDLSCLERSTARTTGIFFLLTLEFLNELPSEWNHVKIRTPFELRCEIQKRNSQGLMDIDAEFRAMDLNLRNNPNSSESTIKKSDVNAFEFDFLEQDNTLTTCKLKAHFKTPVELLIGTWKKANIKVRNTTTKDYMPWYECRDQAENYRTLDSELTQKKLRLEYVSETADIIKKWRDVIILPISKVEFVQNHGAAQLAQAGFKYEINQLWNALEKRKEDGRNLEAGETFIVPVRQLDKGGPQYLAGIVVEGMGPNTHVATRNAVKDGFQKIFSKLGSKTNIRIAMPFFNDYFPGLIGPVDSVWFVFLGLQDALLSNPDMNGSIVLWNDASTSMIFQSMVKEAFCKAEPFLRNRELKDRGLYNFSRFKADPFVDSLSRIDLNLRKHAELSINIFRIIENNLSPNIPYVTQALNEYFDRFPNTEKGASANELVRRAKSEGYVSDRVFSNQELAAIYYYYLNNEKNLKSTFEMLFPQKSK